MEETPKGGRGPPWAVAPLERERKKKRNDSVEGEDFLVYLYASQLLKDDFTAYMKLAS
jgi:hypothetical protein